MSDPHLQSLRLTWRPELSFYEQRVAILKAFDAEGILRAFRVQENFVDARLFDSRDLLTVRQSGLELRLASPGADPDRAWMAVEIALASLQPRRPRNMEAHFKHLAPLKMDFEEALEAVYGRLLGFRGTPAISFGDWAFLVDVEMGSSASGQFEFGIVTADEVLQRFTERVGRIDTGPLGSAEDWEGEEFADVSIFSDCRIVAGAVDPSEDLARQARRFWAPAREEVGSVVEALQDMLSHADTRGVSKNE